MEMRPARSERPGMRLFNLVLLTIRTTVLVLALGSLYGE
jgi:hypothetical protein